MSANFSSGDILTLVMNATLEAYDLPRDPKKMTRAMMIVTEVADGKRTLHFTPSENPQLREEFEREYPGQSFEAFVREGMESERAAARFLRYGELPR